MRSASIEPHKITRPTQLAAVWLAAAVLVDGSLIGGAATIAQPTWVSPMLAVGAVAVPLIVIGLVFLMQTRFRPQLQEDAYYSEYLKRETEHFRGFEPENLLEEFRRPSGGSVGDESWEERERRRIDVYEHNDGLFLVHTWRPSHTSGQAADIAISLCQHGEGPLSQGKVKNVEYHLGRKFFDRPVVKANAEESFRLDVSAYGPMLCLARVNFDDGRPSLDLERYVDF